MNQEAFKDSRLAHLVNALRGIHDPERTLVAVLTFYGDASGHPSQGLILTAGGFLGFEQRWLELETRWRQALADAGVTAFHMTDFIVCSNEFASWKGKERKRQRFLAKLRKIVTDCVAYSFGSNVFLADWKEQNREYELAKNDFQPYALAGWNAVERALGWCDDHAYKRSDVTFIFEHGDTHQENMIRRVEKDYGIIVRTALKAPQKKRPNETPVIQLQSADFAAWHERNMISASEKFGRRWIDIEQAIQPWILEEFALLFSSVGYDHSAFSRQVNGPRGSSLDRLCRDYKIPKREKRRPE